MKIKINYSAQDNKVIPVFPYDPGLVEFVKELGATPVYQEKKFIRWQMDMTSETESALLAHKDDPRLEIAESVFSAFDYLREMKEKNYALSAADHAQDIKVNPYLDPILKDYQRAGIEYMSLNARGVLLGDEMGLGKTLQVLATIERMKFYPALIICPAVVKYNWLRECNKWLPNRRAALIEGFKDKELTGEIYIINYDILQKYWGIVDSGVFDSLVCDESHYLKNYQAKRTLQVQEIAKGIRHKFLLSGTPVLNSPSDLLPQLQILDRLDSFGGFWPFANKYCEAKRESKYRGGPLVWDLSGAANLDDLNKKLRESCYVRREKKEVLKELPEKTRVDLWVKIENGPEYECAEKDVIKYLKESARIDSDYLESISGLPYNEQVELMKEYRQGVAYKAARAESLVKMGVLKQLAAAGKLKAAAAWIEDFFENGGRKLVIFAWHTELIKSVCDLFGCEAITGETSAEERARMVESFQTNPEYKILVCNIQAGGVGITLTAASVSLFLEQGWNPGTMSQAEDRIHRIGQAESVFIYYMLGEGTIDRGIWELIEAKRRVVNDAADGFESIREWMINRSRK